MPRLTRIYLATGAPERFEFLDETFGDSLLRTDDPSTADLVIVDVKNPAQKTTWVHHRTSTSLVMETCPTPVVLAALDGEPEKDAVEFVQKVLPIVPPVYKSEAELKDTLAWIQMMFPLRNMNNLPAQQLETLKTAMLLQAFKKAAGE